GVEDEAVLQVLPSQLAQCPDFLAGEWVRAVDAILGPPHMDAAAIKLDHIPGQLAETFARWSLYSCGMETSGKEPQRVVQQAYALMDCGARARSATRAVDRAGVAQDTQQFRLRPFALVRREPW